jgi:hypothetical protein
LRNLAHRRFYDSGIGGGNLVKKPDYCIILETCVIREIRHITSSFCAALRTPLFIQ